MANGGVPYKKEVGVATFPDTNGWKEFGFNKSFSEDKTPVNLPQASKPSVPYQLSNHQMGKSTGPLATAPAADQVNEV